MTDMTAIGAQVSALAYKVVTLPEGDERTAAEVLLMKNMAIFRDLQALDVSGLREQKEAAVQVAKPGAALAAAKNVLGEASGYLRTIGSCGMGYPQAFNLQREVQRLRGVIKDSSLTAQEQVALLKWAVGGESADPFAAAVKTAAANSGHALDFEALLTVALKQAGQDLSPDQIGRRIYGFLNALPPERTGAARHTYNLCQALFHILVTYHNGYGGGEAAMVYQILKVIHPEWKHYIDLQETVNKAPASTFSDVMDIIGAPGREELVIAAVTKGSLGEKRDLGSVFVVHNAKPSSNTAYRGTESVTVTLPKGFIRHLDTPCKCGQHRKLHECYPCFSKVVKCAELNTQVYLLKISAINRRRIRGYQTLVNRHGARPLRDFHGIKFVHDVFYDTACQETLTGDPHILPPSSRRPMARPYVLEGIGQGECRWFGMHPILGKVLWVEGLPATLLPHASMVEATFYHNDGEHKGGLDLTLSGSVYEFRLVNKMLSLTGARWQANNRFACLAGSSHSTGDMHDDDNSATVTLDMTTMKDWNSLDDHETTPARAYLVHGHKHRCRSAAGRLALLREYHGAMGHCGSAALRDAVRMGAFPGIRVSDVDRWDRHGRCQACTAAKMGHQPQRQDATAGMQQEQRPIGQILQADLFFFRGAHGELQVILLTIDESSGFKMGHHLREKTTAALAEALRDIIFRWKAMGHTVRRIITDRESNFRACKIAMATVEVEMMATAPGMKCAMVERATRTVKDRARASFLAMREKVPGRYLPNLILDIIYMDRYIPSRRRSGRPITPYTLVSPVQDGVDRLNRAVDCTFGESYHFRLPEADRMQVAPAMDVLRSDVGYVIGRDTHADHTFLVYFPRDGTTRQCGAKVPGEADIWVKDAWRRMREEDAIPTAAATSASSTLLREVASSPGLATVPIQWTKERDPAKQDKKHAKERKVPSKHKTKMAKSKKEETLQEKGHTMQQQQTTMLEDAAETPEDAPQPVPSENPPQETKFPLTYLPQAADPEESLLSQPSTSKVTRSGKGYAAARTTRSPSLAYAVKATDTSDQQIRKSQQLWKWLRTPRTGLRKEEDPHRVFMARLLQAYNLRVRTEQKKGPAFAAKLDEAFMAEASNFERLQSFEPISYHQIPDGKKIARCTSVVTVKRDAADDKSWKYKVRGVYNHARGRVKGGHLQDDSPEEPDDYYAPTSRFASVTTILNVATIQQMDLSVIDINAAFLHSPVTDDYYMEITDDLAAALVRVNPAKYKRYMQHGKLLVKLTCSIYGLPEASQLWYQLLEKTMKQLGYTRHPYDSAVFFKRQGIRLIIVCGHVDDLLAAYNDTKLKDALFETLTKRFGTKQQEGNRLMYLGIEIHKVLSEGRFELQLNQHRYESDILQQHNITRTEGTSSPYACSNFFITNTMSPRLDEKKTQLYKQKVAQLNYLATRTRPLLSVGVSYLSGRGAMATEEDMAKVNRMLQYIANTPTTTIRIAPTNDQLQAYADASYASHDSESKRKSQLGYVISLGGSFLTGRSTKTKTTCDSATSAELMALHWTLHEVLWLRKFLNILGIQQQTTTMYEDNDGAEKLAQMQTGNLGLTKHVDIKYFSIRDSIEVGDVRVEHVSTRDMLADGLTKALPRGKYLEAKRRIHHGTLWRPAGRPPIGTSREPLFLNKLGKAMLACFQSF